MGKANHAMGRKGGGACQRQLIWFISQQSQHVTVLKVNIASNKYNDTSQTPLKESPDCLWYHVISTIYLENKGFSCNMTSV